MTLRIAASDLKRRRVEIYSSHQGSGQGMRKRNSDRSRPGAHVDDAGRRADTLQRCFHQVLSLGTRDQNIGRDLELQAKELLHAGDVLHRLRSQAAPEQASN